MIRVPINNRVLTWAMHRANVGPEDLALSLNEPIEKINSYIQGTEFPPLGLLEKIAYTKLKIPLALFLFPAPPNLPDPIAKLRRLPDTEQIKMSHNVLSAIRIAQSYQDSLEVLIGQPTRNIGDISSLFGDNIPDAALRVREQIGLEIDTQLQIRSAGNFLKLLRYLLEPWGIFTFKGPLEDKTISGFCLDSENFPVIFINNSNSFPRQVFTLAHELGHILNGVSGITDVDETYISEMSPRDRDLEVKCNRFASFFLLPKSENSKIISMYQGLGIDGVTEAANRYSISREFVLRRLLDLNILPAEVYESWAAKWNKDYLRKPRESTGGDYYVTQISYLGETYVRSAFRKYHSGQITHSDLAMHLNIRPSKVLNIEAYLR